MKENLNFKRRNLLSAIISAPFLLVACASNKASIVPKQPEAIRVDVTGVKDVPSLIAAIKVAGANVLPKNLPVEAFYKEFAKQFVKNATAAVDRGFKIPNWVLDRLPPERKVLLPAFGLVAFTIGGALFVMPLDVIFIAVLASLTLMTVAIYGAITSLLDEKTNYTPRI